MTAGEEKELRAGLEKLILSRERVAELEKQIKAEEEEQKKYANTIIKAARGKSNEFPPSTMLELFKPRRAFILRFESETFWDPIVKAKNILVEEIKKGFKK